MGEKHEIPKELRRKYWGCRAGKRQCVRCVCEQQVVVQPGHITVKERVCSPDIELLAPSPRLEWKTPSNLFTLYTSDFRFCSQSCHLQKFSDYSVIVGCISRDQEEEYRSVVDRFVAWCGLNQLPDFRKQDPSKLRLFFLRRLRSFNVCRTMLQMFYHSVVSSIIFYAVVCWGSRLKTADTNRLNKLIRRAGSVLGS
ncbi:hypothetical protein L3Q82_025245 [Scortum barcoo]|uniref:Uncharacterized protein n=1 Tax=Scortum barcoo TaxID=214431 RepID=A0ACB8WR43_9TELE|nr:hypothetical protein L3Q82_025245 [Scortum barcoo]